MANSVTVRTSAPGAKETASDIDNLRASFDKLNTTAKGAVVGAVLGTIAMKGAQAIGGLANEYDDASDRIRTGTGLTGAALADLEQSFQNVAGRVKEDIGVTASVMTELNKRTGLTGQGLEELTVQVIEFSRVTGTDATQNVAQVTRVFGDWSIATEDQAETMDKLLRASQATGIGVDDLMQKVVDFGAPLRTLGFTFDESIALLGKWEEEGVNVEAVLAGMKIGLGNLAASGVPANEMATTFRERLEAIRTSATPTADAIKLFGKRAGPDLAAAILEGRFSIDDLMDTIENGSETVRQAAEDTRDAGDAIAEFKNKVKVAIGPLVDDFAGLTDEMGNAIYLMPALGGALGGVTGKLIAQTAALKAANGGWIGLGKAAGPFGAIAAGVTIGLIGIDQAAQKVTEHTAPLIEHIENMSEAEREAARTSEVLGMNAAELSGGMADLIDLVGLVAPGFNSASTGMRGVADAAAEAVYGFNNVALATHLATERADELMAPIAEVADELSTTLPTAATIAEQSLDHIGGKFASTFHSMAQTAEEGGEDIMHSLATGMEQAEGSVHDEWKDFVHDLNNPFDAMKEIAFLNGKLTGRALADGLESSDPITRARAEEMRDHIAQQLNDLKALGYDIGDGTGNQVASGIDDSTPRAVRQAAQLAAAVNAALASIRSTVKVDVKGRYFGKSLPGLAKGGPVEAGEPYLVNEDTPNSEVFVPKVSGTIVPRNKVNEGQHMAPFGSRDDRTPSRIDVHVNLSTREVAQMQKHYAVVGGGPAFR